MDIDIYGLEIFKLIEELYPICRSITGNGVRSTLEIIKKHIPITVHEVASGTQVLDWVIPEEWNVVDAFVKDEQGIKVIDFKKSNLHLLNYSSPIHKFLQLDELKEHLYFLPDHPEWIPYVTSYYQKNWGFCLSYDDYNKLTDGIYEVFIDTSFKAGNLTYGEFLIKGQSEKEVVISCYLCHPSLCNDSLTGVAIAAFLAKHLKSRKHYYSYRFLFIPETIGSITWLHFNEDKLGKIEHGLIATCLGDNGAMTYKKSRQGNAKIDKVVEKVLIDSGNPYNIIEFDPSDGSDDRQYCSTGFNLPFGTLMRTKYGCFPEYHTSADNLDFIKPDYLGQSLKYYIDILYYLEKDDKYLNIYPKGEPNMGKRNLYRSVNKSEVKNSQAVIFWVLNFSDGQHSLLDISYRSGFSFREICNGAKILCEAGLIQKIE